VCSRRFDQFKVILGSRVDKERVFGDMLCIQKWWKHDLGKDLCN
jgi:hypothetical protein